MPKVNLDPLEIFYREAGHRDGRQPTLLLIHPAGGSANLFLEVMNLLSPTRHVMALDLPGHGQSDSWAPPLFPEELLERYRELVAQFAEKLGLGRFVAVGHSMGGAVALELALAYPERLEGLIVLASGGRLKVAPMVLDTIRKAFDQVPQLMGAVGFSPSTEPRLAATLGSQLVQCSSEVYWADMKACATFDRRDRVKEILTPTLVISATDDLLVPPKIQQQLVDSLPQARLATVTRAGHFLFLERPDVTAELIASL
jgi:pimeloyl-ACP methyl ester carboxylesterase